MTTSTTHESEEAVKGVLDRLQDTWQAGDADAVSQIYTDDATLIMTGVFLNGREEIRQFMAAAFAGALAGSRPHNVPRLIRRINDDTVVVISDIGILLAGQDQVADGEHRIATWTITRLADGWRVAAYHNCPVP
ncbi:SgcJ/EcaC family oxidoreductase [Dactylosporangium vinaceum]|uniref:SgcJ/EcaC family oxidoreductase n=1 Tax=Dactylosporangium vinaceum TaxID=53362 RepID=A0ABV5M3D5_9ACTN|nr:SgcJ/EcaC family oxidoreductase [Dactylosporangium vinaceum]UAB99738.1 SgcJ/EcaC family oxidoreductase [Dactylosporangium vinaceum]